ncbi:MULTISPECIES: hypothetical protein [unclassified Novosphingobium]|uniref:hypothetical protein n=1 Tax=unclassified Novosphingobium TaxID=2644732 RepID=UPI001357BE4C|nr:MULTISPECIES: hypothetical protein [unclassified Novosphingobium]
MKKRVRGSRFHFKTILALTLGLWMLLIGTALALQAAFTHDGSRRKVGPPIALGGLPEHYPVDG